MKSLLTFCLIASLAAPAFAEVPRSPRPDRYKDLYLRSAFCDPPEVEVGPEIPNDLPDWVLVGLSKYTNGVKVKLMNKKDRTRVTIPSPEATEMGFAIEDVKQDRNFIDEAVVTVRKGAVSGEVRFDPQFLVLKAVAGAPAAAQQGRGAPAPTKPGTVPTPPTPGQPTPTPGQPTPTPPTASRTNTPPTPGKVPRPSTSPNQVRPTSSSTPSSRRRYIPRSR